jgi:hypothetical protein
VVASDGPGDDVPGYPSSGAKASQDSVRRCSSFLVRFLSRLLTGPARPRRQGRRKVSDQDHASPALGRPLTPASRHSSSRTPHTILVAGSVAKVFLATGHLSADVA